MQPYWILYAESAFGSRCALYASRLAYTNQLSANAVIPSCILSAPHQTLCGCCAMQTQDRLVLELPDELRALPEEALQDITWTAFSPGFQPISVQCSIPSSGTQQLFAAFVSVSVHLPLMPSAVVTAKKT